MSSRLAIFFALHYHVSVIASSAIKPAPIYVPRAVCVCVIYRVSQQTPIISVCKQQFAPLARRREIVAYLWAGTEKHAATAETGMAQ